MIRLSVLSGPDTGLSRTFRVFPIRIGRGYFNEFQLTDPLVSQRHGELIEEEGALVFRDLGSRHGSEVRPGGGAPRRLHARDRVQTERVNTPLHLLLGSTRILCEGAVTTESGRSEPMHVERSVHETLEQFTRRIHLRDPRIGSLLDVARTLNGLSGMDAVLDAIADATFEAFPGARRVAVCLPSPGGGLAPLKIHHRGTPHPEGMQAHRELLSQSILGNVFRRQQAVLFYRDGNSSPSESVINAGISALMAAPLVGHQRTLGVIQADTEADGAVFGTDDLDVFTALASYAALALERQQLHRNLVDMFESVVRMSVKAIDARDPATAGHSERVARASVLLARAISESDHPRWNQIQFHREQLLELRYASLLHDFGKVAVRERVLTKGTRLDPALLGEVRARAAAVEAGLRTEGWIALAQDPDAPADPDARAAWVDARIAPRLTLLRAGMDALERNQTGAAIPAEDRATLDRLTDFAWKDLDGRTKPLLSPEHLECMRIPRGTLTPDEWDEMRTHVTHSWEFLSQIPWSEALARVPLIARGHHERLDGSGYPDALEADDIPLEVRILSIADMFDAITSVDRAYRKAASPDDAITILRRDAERGLLDHDLVELFVERVIPRLDRWGTRETLAE